MCDVDGHGLVVETLALEGRSKTLLPLNLEWKACFKCHKVLHVEKYSLLELIPIITNKETKVRYF